MSKLILFAIHHLDRGPFINPNSSSIKSVDSTELKHHRQHHITTTVMRITLALFFVTVANAAVLPRNFLKPFFGKEKHKPESNVNVGCHPYLFSRPTPPFARCP